MGLLDGIFGGGSGGEAAGAGAFAGMLMGPALQMGPSIWQNQQNSWQADHAMDRSESMAREEMQFQERMSNSAYQRATADMTKAGINPMVAYQQGGASTPSGAMGSGTQARMESIAPNLASSALDFLRLKKEMSQADSGIALNDALSTKALADAGAAGASAKESTVRTEATASQLRAIAARAKADEIKSGYDAKAGTYDAIMNRVNRDSGTAANVLRMFTPKGGSTPSGPPDHLKIDPNTGEILQESQKWYNDQFNKMLKN